MNRALPALALLLLLSAAAAAPPRPAAAPVDTPEAARWRADLRHMAREMPRWHRDLFHTMTRQQFEAAVRRLDERIPSLARHQIIVEMQRIVAMAGDGHTNVYPTRDARIGFRTLPVKLYAFADGLFVRAASREHAGLVGARVVRVGGVPVAEALARAGELVGRDNEMGALFFAPQLLAMPEVLHALGIADEVERVALVVEKDGRRRTVTLAPAGPVEILPADTDLTWLVPEGWVDLRDGAGAPPLWLRNPKEKHWLEHLPAERILYAQINQIGDEEGETLAAFAARLVAAADSLRVGKLVLDLRLDRGGNGGLLRPLVRAIVKSPLDRPGGLFVLMGRSTFSAAQFLLDDLEEGTSALFVGEPSGSRGNAYGDSRRITLPASGITVRVSIYYWQDWHPMDGRPWTAPHLTAELTSAEYRAGRDPALAAVIAYRPEPGVTALMEEPLARGDTVQAAARYREFMEQPLHRRYDPEDSLRALGVRSLRARRPAAAVAVLRLAAEANPRSAWAHALLGEAHAMAGDTASAVASLRRSLAVYPRNPDLAGRLAQLEGD